MKRVWVEKSVGMNMGCGIIVWLLGNQWNLDQLLSEIGYFGLPSNNRPRGHSCLP
jgi:hypothetical protein